MYLEPKRFFVRELLLMLIGFGGIVITVIFSEIGGAAILLAVIVNLIIFVSMLVMFLISIIHFLRYLSDKENHQSFGMYVLNGLFSFFVLGIFGAFYFIIIIGGWLILLPFTQ